MPKIPSPTTTTMKRPLHLLFPLLLLVASVTTLSCRVAIRRPITVFGNGVEPKHPKCSEPNSTLLKMAAIDIGEEKAKQEIEHLLEGSYGNHGRHRSISSWRRENHNPDDHVTFHLRATSTRGFPVPAYLRSPKYFNNWPEFRRVLRNWFRRKRYQPEIMLELIDQVKYPIDQFNGLSTKGPYSSCAVIGNSGILLKSDQGELIDSHEVVIRLNNARTKGFERNVGAKTSISFVNSNILHLCGRREGCFCHPYGEKVPIVMYICQAAHFMDYTVCNSSHKAPLLVTDVRLDVLSARIVKYYSLKRFVEETGKNVEEWAAAHDGSQFHYSSGMQAVMLALGVCGRVSIFGFGKSALARHHYHTNQKAELHLHDYEAEYAFYHDLVTNPQVIPFIADKFKIPPVVIYQ